MPAGQDLIRRASVAVAIHPYCRFLFPLKPVRRFDYKCDAKNADFIRAEGPQNNLKN